MDLYFSRRRFFETAFLTPYETKSQEDFNHLKEVYRVSTTVRKCSILPETTTIEFVGSEDEEKHYVVATIEWRWPSQASSIIEIDGKRLALKDFMKKEGLLSTGTHVTVGDELFTWRSCVSRPAQLFDSQNRSVARCTPHPSGLRPLGHVLSVQPACLHLEQDLVEDAYARDTAVASYFVYRACRDLHILLTPWWREEQADFTGMKVKVHD